MAPDASVVVSDTAPCFIRHSPVSLALRVKNEKKGSSFPFLHVVKTNVHNSKMATRVWNFMVYFN
jgi:hypothetical protein